jgi:hypothetical protein
MNNIRYTVMESPHRWLILAGITALVTLLGTITILVYAWSHLFGRVFFYAGFALTAAFLLLALLDWKDAVQEEMAREERSGARGSD